MGQSIFEQHGIIVENVVINWIDLAVQNQSARRIHSVEAR